jgi:ferritin-like metal-binding protein YciE
MDCREWLVSWLNDAYAMEEGMVNTLKNHVDQLEDRPDIQTAVRAHMEHTKSQSQRVRRCLEMLGEKPSTMKKWGMEMMASMQASGMRMADDKVIKDLLAEYGSEHFEIASYRALVQAATICGEEQVTMICREILREEEQMAQTLSQSLETVVAGFLRSPVTAGAR